MKTFWAFSIHSFICRFFIYLPIACGFILWMLEFDFRLDGIGFFLGGFVGSYLMYFCNLGWFLGYSNFGKNDIFVPSDFLPKLTRLQYKVKVNYNDICAIEFKEGSGNSLGKPLWKADCINYLEITLNDNSMKRISISKFTKRQWRKMEMIMKDKNPNILILKSAEELIRFKKNR